MHKHRIPKITNANVVMNRISTRKDIEDYVNDILNTIEDEIFKAAEIHQLTSIKIELPTVFTVAGISNKDAQLQIYYSLIESLEESGYETKIEFKNRVYIHLSWKKKEDNKSKEFMDKFIKKHAI